VWSPSYALEQALVETLIDGRFFLVLNGHLPVPHLVLQVPLLIWIKGAEPQLCFGAGSSRTSF
jgi:hypothetical protein